MSSLIDSIPAQTVPTSQAITAWKNKADKLVALDAEVTALSAALEAKLKPIREAAEPDIEAKRKELARLKAEVVAFGVEHRDSVFVDGSEIKTKVSIIVGRNTPEGVAVEDDFTEAEVIEALKSEKKLAGFLSVKYSLDKPAIKKALGDAAHKCREALGLAGLCLQSGFSVSVKSKGE